MFEIDFLASRCVCPDERDRSASSSSWTPPLTAILALPSSLIAQLEAEIAEAQSIRFADGTKRERPRYELTLLWGDEERVTEVLTLEKTRPCSASV